MNILPFLFMLLLLSNKICYSQDSTFYFKFADVVGYSNYQGVIVPASYDLTWLKRIKGQFTLTKEEIIESEEILLCAIKDASIGDSLLTKRAIDRYREFYRQYVGFIDGNGTRKVLINMIRPGGISTMSDKDYWRKAFLVMTNWSDKYRVAYVVDIEKKSIADDSNTIALFICDCYYSKQ